MKIGVISDTHDQQELILQCVQMLNENEHYASQSTKCIGEYMTLSKSAEIVQKSFF